MQKDLLFQEVFHKEMAHLLVLKVSRLILLGQLPHLAFYEQTHQGRQHHQSPKCMIA